MSTEEKFLAAVDVIENIPSDGTFQPSEDLMLKLCAYYMQATQGPCRVSKPSIWYYSSRSKWNAWNDLGNMDREVAMEKYVEELIKVIETMSYNERVSKFMSLIGPFYEVVSAEEIDDQPERGTTKKKLAEYSYPVKNLRDMQCLKMEQNPKESMEKDCKSSFSSIRSTKCRKVHERSIFNENRKNIPRQSVLDMFKPRVSHRHQPFGSHQDMLILTIINLQNSLQEIVNKLDNLQSLAKSADFNFESETREQIAEELNLGYSGTAFALLWPVALSLFF